MSSNVTKTNRGVLVGTCMKENLDSELGGASNAPDSLGDSSGLDKLVLLDLTSS